jgi:hypothetical protein
MAKLADLPHGTEATLSADYDVFVDASGVFAIGVDLSAPGFSSGAAILFLGDDEYYHGITQPFAVERLEGMAVAIDSSITRLNVIAPLRGGRDERRRVRSSFAGGPLPAAASTDELRLHPGALAIGDTLALVAEPFKDRVVAHIYHKDDDASAWASIGSYDSHWLPRIGDALRRTALEATPDQGRSPRR